ncbi:MAG: M23 family metallopeptidase [Pyrinomonadaceae bacterium]|nr:M23 family metallopeptidase [Pyrinomonadaceae bacterium]
MLCKFLIFLPALFFLFVSCGTTPTAETEPQSGKSSTSIAKKFSYPVGEKEVVTEARDKQDGWYNAQDFGENNHLGEDWNANSGGNSDCGEPVYAVANGEITYAEDAGADWGNVIIITHRLPNGKRVQTLYGHLEKILKTSGEVKRREKVGTVGNADGKYLCHLHFELRDENCLLWDRVFIGYSPVRTGWLDGSDFIDKYR